MTNLNEVDWSKLPSPKDDGGAAHLTGMKLAPVRLATTRGVEIDLAALVGVSVIYAYPMTGRPDVTLPDGWDEIPGARGCTPQSCAFRDHHGELTDLGVAQVFGLSTQTSEYQREAAERMHLPFPLLSDADLTLTKAMQLPTFNVDGATLLKRLTMIVQGDVISKVFYPVFPPDRNAPDVMQWLQQNN